MKTTISITQEDIDRGARGARFLCAGARAVNRVLADGFHCDFGYKSAHIFTGQRPHARAVHTFVLPQEAEDFVNQFDREMHVQPMTFEVWIPKEFLK